MLLFLTKMCFAQQQADFEVFPLPNIQVISSIETSPDQSYMAIGTGQGPLYFWDFEKNEVIRTIDIDGFYAGPRLKFSNDGKYLLCQQQFYLNFSPNKDKPVRVEVLDIASGKFIFNREGVHAAQLLSDNKTLVTLEGNMINVFDFLSGDKLRSQTVPETMFAMAVSPDMKTIAISHKTEKEDLDELPFFRSDKDARKQALKKTHIVALYDFETFKRKGLVQEIFDLVFSVTYSKDGKDLMIYTLPHSRQGARPGGLVGFISKAEAQTGVVTRATFMSKLAEPDFKVHSDNQIIGVGSIELKGRSVPQVLLSDYNTGTLLKKFDVNTRFMEVLSDGRITFAFPPHHNFVIVAYGNKIAKWKLK